MKTLRLIPDETRIDFVGRRMLAFALSAFLIFGSIGLFFGKGLNLGIDFLGGVLIEAKTDGPAKVGELRSVLENLNLGDVTLQEFGAPDDVLIRIQRQEGGDEAQRVAVDTVKKALGDRIVEYRRTEFVGPTVGEELQETTIWAVLAAVGAILLYVWFRFEWQFGVAAIVALTHDVISIIGLFALFQFPFDLSTVAAVLTVAGYSINDTVVVFDRIRENLRRFKKMPLIELYNLSINETLSRTVMTSLTTMLALIGLYVFGGAVIRDFTIALIWGILVGTYSSITVATPLMLYIKPPRGSGETAEEKPGAPAAGASKGVQ